MSNAPTPPTITLLTPVFNEEASLPAYEQAVRQTLLSRDDYRFRVLLIDDGSGDSSWSMIRDICRRDPRFTGIRLSRNYGSHKAFSAGFAHAEGDAVATLACDLQDPPETILEFIQAWEAGPRIVWGKRRSRQDAKWRMFTSNLFFNLLRRYAMPRGSKFTTGSFLLVDRRVAECFRQFHETNRITFALVAWTGFDQAVVEYDRRKRQAGASGWNFRRMMHAMYDAFIGFSTLPIRLITIIGLSTFLLAMMFTLYVIIAKFIGYGTPGWASQVITVSFFSGIQFLLLGMMGEYLYRIYAEVVRRPLYFIADRTEDQANDE